MVTPELIEYIKKCRETSLSDEQIKINLIAAGWKEEDIIEGIKPSMPSEVAPVPPRQVSVPDVSLGSGETKKHGKKFVFIAIPVLFFILAGGAGAYLLIMGNNPNVLIGRVVEGMQEIKSFHAILEFETSFSTTIPPSRYNLEESSKISNSIKFLANVFSAGLSQQATDSQKLETKMNYKMEGDFNIEDKESPKADLKLEFSAPYFSISGDDKRLSADILLVDKKLYLKTEDMAAFFSKDTQGKAKAKWVEMEASFKNAPVGVGMDLEKMKISEDQVKKIRELIKKERFIDAKKIGSEEINGAKTKHYRLNIDKAKLKNFIIEADKILNSDFIMEDNETKELDEVIQNINIEEFDFWIGEKDNLLYRFKLSSKTDTKETGQSIAFNFSLNFSEFGKTVNVVRPALEEIISYSEILGTTMLKARDTRRIGDLRQIALALEMYYDDHISTGYPKTLSAITEGNGYMTVIPKDPLTGKEYSYIVEEGNKKYVLGATLEQKDNTALAYDTDGAVFGLDCNDPVYCIQP